MKGGASIEVLLDLALGKDLEYANQALNVLKTQVFLYDADMRELRELIKGNSIAQELLLSYSNAEFFTKLPDIPEEIEVVTYVAGVGDISTDLLHLELMLTLELIENSMDSQYLIIIKDAKDLLELRVAPR